MRQDVIIWQFYSHGVASSYGFVEDFSEEQLLFNSARPYIVWVLMEGELGAEIEFVSDNADHN